MSDFGLTRLALQGVSVFTFAPRPTHMAPLAMSVRTRGRTLMQKKPEFQEVVEGWLAGNEESHGMTNPAGPLFVGGERTEQALTESNLVADTGCSSCTASTTAFCC